MYLTPPSTRPIRNHIRQGILGAIATPLQGNHIERGWIWAADNNCFRDGAYVGDDRFLRWLDSQRPYAADCLFVAAPDVVGDAWRTADRSLPMMPRIRALGYKVAFVAQDGLTPVWPGLLSILAAADCLFIGGTDEFKLGAHAAGIARIAARHGLDVHCGRVNSERRYRYAHAIGCDSVDGTYLTRAPDKNLPHVLAWRRGAQNQLTLDFP